MVLSESTLEQGRAYIRACDLEGITKWMLANTPRVNIPEYRRQYATFFRYERDGTSGVSRALIVFRATFAKYDPQRATMLVYLKYASIMLAGLLVFWGVTCLIR